MSMPCRKDSCRRTGWAVAWWAAGALLIAAPAYAAQATVDDALAVQPRQKNIDHDRPSSEQIKQCTISQEKLDGITALVVRGPAGEILRAFADTNGDRVVDRWSYFRDGVEVYRDIDSTHDTKADQFRWLNSGGTRWGIDTSGDGVIDSWKMLSAEEASAEIVAALRDRDPAAFARLLPTRADLEVAGFTGERLEELALRVKQAAAGFSKLAASQQQVGPSARWTSMLTPQPPGVIPAGAPGVTEDVVAYDNVVALIDNPGTSGGGETGQVYVGSLLRCGGAWRPVDVPQLMGTGSDITDAGGFFTPPPGGHMAAGLSGMQDERLKPLVAKLQEVESRLVAAPPADRGPMAKQQVELLEQLLASCAESDRGFWNRQLVETLAAYVQEGLLPEGTAKLEALAKAAGDDSPETAFIAFRLAQARYSAAMQQPDVDGEKLQNRWFDDLAAFVDAYPNAPESAEAMLQLGFRDEFEGRESEAIERYRSIADSFADTNQARKAVGAIRRLESVGRPFTLTGTGVDGRTMAVESLRGVPVLVHYWSTDCEPCKVDLAQIRELQARFGPKRFGVVGVALDGDKTKLAKFLTAKPIPWPQLHEPGGLDSRLAEEYGVLALPTMILIDASGNVVDRNVSITELERKLEALVGK